ncbi:MAG TPA: hypothetical protein VLT33_46170 [Labilithrix sp.]|nr:hypothetical protein [Labilithrix sp.]
MNADKITSDVKAELTKGLEKLAMLRDEAKLHLHLASLDAKQEWDDKLEPGINDMQTKAAELTETSKTAVHELVERVEGFVSKLRSKATHS